jgi:hypothetical protein
MNARTMADPWEELQTEAVAIVAAAADRDVTLRVVGSAASGCTARRRAR